jgi:hypothetical protein
MTERYDFSGLRDFSSDRMYADAASAILRLAKSRFQEVLRLPIPVPLKKAILALAPKSAFGTISPSFLLDCLKFEDDGLRTLVALKTVQTSSKKRLQANLRSYLNSEDGPYYYNVVHWLDFGAALPASSVSHGVRQELSTFDVEEPMRA